MAYIDPTVRAELIATRAELAAMLVAINATYLAALGKRTKEYRFDSGVSSQREEYRSLKDLREERRYIENEIKRIDQRLNGTGVVNLNVRRIP